MKQPWARRVAWSPGHRLSSAYRWTWAALAVLTALVSAIASVWVLTPLATLLTLATFLCVFVSGGVLVAWAWERPGRSAVVPTVVAAVLLTAWVSLLVCSVAWALLLMVLVATSPRVHSVVRAWSHWSRAGPGSALAGTAQARPCLARRRARGRRTSHLSRRRGQALHARVVPALDPHLT